MRRTGRRVPVGVPAAALLLALAGCSAAPPAAAPARTLPADVQGAVVQWCLGQQGVPDPGWAGIELSNDREGRVVAEPRTPDPDARSAASQLQGCLDDHPVALAWSGRPTSVQLNLLYDHYAGTLWPCLAAHGIDAGPIPERSAMFADRDAPIDPYTGEAVDRLGLTELRHLVTACPAVPGYLPTGFFR